MKNKSESNHQHISNKCTKIYKKILYDLWSSDERENTHSKQQSKVKIKDVREAPRKCENTNIKTIKVEIIYLGLKPKKIYEIDFVVILIIIPLGSFDPSFTKKLSSLNKKHA